MGSAAPRYAAVGYNDESVHQDPEGGGIATVRRVFRYRFSVLRLNENNFLPGMP
jgi:hypothetical protein